MTFCGVDLARSGLLLTPRFVGGADGFGTRGDGLMCEMSSTKPKKRGRPKPSPPRRDAPGGYCIPPLVLS